MADIAEAQKAADDARLALLKLEQEHDRKSYERRTAACDAIRRELDAEYGERLRVLRAAVDATKRALDATKAEQGKDKLAAYPPGVVCEWARPRHASATNRTLRLTDRKGKYEVRTPETQFGGNLARYSLPAMGDVFIRLLKKDGTPGARIERISEWSGQKWLPEGETPAKED